MFVKYCHIENAYQLEQVNLIRAAGLSEVECVCSLKIDGSNFQVDIDEAENVNFGTRNQELPKDADFSGWQAVEKRDHLVEKCRKVKKLLSAKKVIVFGELCGGLYRHSAVEKDKTAVRIQGRVDYSPSNLWVVFDIFTDGRWVKQSEVQEVAAEAGLLSTPILFRGTFEECLKFPLGFIDPFATSVLGLPQIDGNVAEGVVIKSEDDVRLPNGDRLIIKNKDVKFKERIRKTKAESLKPGLNAVEQKWAERLSALLNESRAWSAKSKLGPKAEFGDLLREVMTDAEAELREEWHDELEKDERELDPKDFKMKEVRKSVNKIAVAAVRQVFMANMNK